MKKILLYIARHGTTDDSIKNIFRGDRNSKLDKKGFIDAHDLRKHLVDKKWSRIYCSPLTRAIQTGYIIGEPRKIVPLMNKELLPWDIGYLTGKDKEKFGPEMKYFIDNPEETPEGGESRLDFEQERVLPLIGEAMEMGLRGDPVVLIGHSSIIHALGHMLYGENDEDNDGNHKIAVSPGGIVTVYLEDGEIKAEATFKKGMEDSSYSVDSKTKKHQPSS